MTMTAPLEVDDYIRVVGGKHIGRRGFVVKVTAKMVLVRLANKRDDVRIYQCHVEKMEVNVGVKYVDSSGSVTKKICGSSSCKTGAGRVKGKGGGTDRAIGGARNAQVMGLMDERVS
jgi:hypothetical protein